MRITAKLAYSQLKINRSRTRWSVIAIALSTALMTAICSFIASGNAMLIDLLGEDYGQYSQSYKTLLLIPIIIFGILIMSMTITVISNVFRISTQDRINQFGILKCTGATPKQIKETVMYESLWLCLFGIPIGLVLGVLFSYAGIGVANHFFGNLNALVHLMIQKLTITLHYVFSWKAMLFSVIFSLLVVLYSAWRPAHKAAKISAIQCIHGADEIKVEEKSLKDNKIIAKLFGVEGILADKNMKRNRRNFRATVVSLSIGIILFISLGGLTKQAKGIEEYMYPDVEETVITEYSSDYSYELVENTGNYERRYYHPINNILGEEIAKKLEEYENINVWGIGGDIFTYHTQIPADQVTIDMKKVYESKNTEVYDFLVEILTLDKENYERLCNIADVPVGSTILINDYSYNDFGYEKSIEPFLSSIKNLQLIKADNSILDIEIQGTISGNQIPTELIYPATRPVRVLLPEAEVSTFNWSCAPKNEDEFMEYAKKIMQEYFPNNSSNSYMANGYNTRVFRVKEYMQVMNIAISLVSVFMYSFVVLLMLIGLTNVISTLSTNVMMRSKEFAVLKSIGMTPEGLKRMLNFESILCSLKALVVGIPVGLIVTISVNLPIRMMFPVTYQLPWLSIILCVLVVFIITLGTVAYASHKLKNQNIIETIRSASGK